MGISSSRSSGSSNNYNSRVKKSTNEVSEQIKFLAPKDACCEDEEESYECCICFVNFLAINHTICCNERICTSCYLLIASHENRGSKNSFSTKGITCPFCNRQSFAVVYRALKRDNHSTNETKQSREVSVEDSTDVKFSPQISSKKNTINIPLSTIADRKQIENEIKSQHRLFKTNSPMGNNSTTASHYTNFSSRSQYRNNSSIYNDLSTPNIDSSSMLAESLQDLMNNGNASDFDKIDELILEETIKMSLNELNTGPIHAIKNSDCVPSIPHSDLEESSRLSNPGSIVDMREMLESLTANGNLSEEEQLELVMVLSQLSQNER